jgi:hypothetical protein
MTPGLRVEVEIDLAGHPFVVQFGEHGRDESETGIGIREDVRAGGCGV